MKHVVKRNNSIENYNEHKLYASVYASCLSVQDSLQNSAKTANKVTKGVTLWLGRRSEVTTKDIHKKTTDILKEFNPHASYLYAHHRIML
jgi:transcriptional regulator NrdR family protein